MDAVSKQYQTTGADPSQMDPIDELFSELTPTTSDCSEISRSSSRKVLGRAYGIELSGPVHIFVTPKQQDRIDKMLSDVAHILRSGDDDDDDSSQNKSWYYSSLGNETDVDPNKEKKEPLFTRGFAVSLSSEIERKEEIQVEEKWSACFNCEGAHNVSECPEPKDMSRIRRNRMLFQEKSISMSVSRTKQKDLKFGKYTPGQISETLRDAMGLPPDELPPWIYEMRTLGYPPAYYRLLMEPKTNLIIYDGQNFPNGAEHKESVLVPNVSDFVNYPGFNVPVPEGVLDRAINFGFPPMLEEHAKEAFLSSLSPCWTLHDSDGQNGKTRHCAEFNRRASMDMEHSSSNERVVTKSASGSGQPCESSPSIQDLEEKRKQILSQLEEPSPKKQRLEHESSVENGLPSTSSSGNSDAMDLASPDSTPVRESVADDFPATPKMIPLDSRSTPSTSGSISQSVFTEAGSTPVHHKYLQGSTPQLDKFASDITPFEPKEESLPRSGGGYKKMKQILSQKI